MQSDWWGTRGRIEEDLEGIVLSCVMKEAEEAVELQSDGFDNDEADGGRHFCKPVCLLFTLLVCDIVQSKLNFKLIHKT